ncbi:hypothetical protein [Schaalia sp. ZJ1691]|uniref:hypothetical protein n=1 Tax=Schaalia sp. ZJ1691 TaxID=2709404 RepID=UPI0013EBD5E7|nr:hypothetical protein [Schaalia sp. ZJ1691]
MSNEYAALSFFNTLDDMLDNTEWLYLTWLDDDLEYVELTYEEMAEVVANYYGVDKTKLLGQTGAQ